MNDASLGGGTDESGDTGEVESAECAEGCAGGLKDGNAVADVNPDVGGLVLPPPICGRGDCPVILDAAGAGVGCEDGVNAANGLLAAGFVIAEASAALSLATKPEVGRLNGDVLLAVDPEPGAPDFPGTKALFPAAAVKKLNGFAASVAAFALVFCN